MVWRIVARALRATLASSLLIGAACAHALDANTATADELQALPGIGPSLSARIVDERGRNPFADLEDLKSRVRGVGDANLRKMREAGLEVGPSGRVADFGGQPAAAAAANADRKAARSVQTFVGRPPSGTAARVPANGTAAQRPARKEAQRARSR